MPQIDLITGFLGAGKTTFIKDYAKFMIDQNVQLGILESDYGAINIDMVLLQDLIGENCEVEMVIGGDGVLSHRRRFQTKLIAMAMTGYDCVIVEPSGIFDTDEFFDILAEEPLCSMYSPGTLVAIVDADLPEELSEETEFLLVSQTACAGMIVLSRWQESYGEERIEQILAHLNRALERFHCDRRFTREDIFAKEWDKMTAEDYEKVALASMIPASFEKLPVQQESGYGTLFYFGTRMEEEEVCKKVQETFADPACGNVIRIKGFVRTGDNTRVQINATRGGIEIEPTIFANEVLIVTGENLHRDRIDGIWAGSSEIVTPGKESFGF